MSEGSLSIMSATTSVPRARDEENHFPARKTRGTNRQSSRPSVVTEMSSTMVTGSYWPSCTLRYLPKQGIITAQICYVTRKVKQTNGKEKYDYRIKQPKGKADVFTHKSWEYILPKE